MWNASMLVKEYIYYMRRGCCIHTKTTWKMNFAAFNRSYTIIYIIYFSHRTKSRFINIDRDGFCVGLYVYAGMNVFKQCTVT